MIKDELEYLEFTNNKSHLKLTLQGAHIFDFQVNGKEPLLFLSESARFEKGVPIRGGVPICWPWFGPHPSDKSLPNHGFARISLWKHECTEELSAEKTKIILSLKSSIETLKLWPYAFELSLEIIMSDVLEVCLITKNSGKESFLLTQALHTYLKVDDISTLKLEGLDKTVYYNKLDDTYNNRQEGQLLFSGEVDRVYSNVNEDLSFKNKKEWVSVKTEGSNTVVVWNPGEELVQKMPDLHTHQSMLCIESANALENKIELKAGETHILRSILSQS